ncbi:MAG: sterol desaturase family protein [Bacteroidota bacterium]
MEYVEIFLNGYRNYASYLWREVTNPHGHNYFYWLLGVSAFFLLLEWIRPWRKDQARFRKDFWLDFFYMFFNFFLFSLIIYNAASDVVVNMFHDVLGWMGIENLVALQVQSWPIWAHLLLGFVVRDFIQWWVHRLLHKVPWLWEFHKVHHSVREMGFAAHLRYHWMENVVYRTLEYFPLALIGIGLNDFFIIHIFTLAVGHYNHSNLSVSGRVSGGILGGLIGLWMAMSMADHWLIGLGIVLGSAFIGVAVLSSYMKIIFNSPELHIWHHAYHLPEDRKDGVNFALTLAIWDYLFRTNYLPHDGRDIELGFPGVEEFPQDFAGQNLHGFRKGGTSDGTRKIISQ